MRLFRPGFSAGCLYPGSISRVKTAEKVLYLTFDDGPDPMSTPSLLAILRKHNIKVIFFCPGNSAVKFPDLMKQITGEGHFTGNHSYSHRDGWRTGTTQYVDDVMKATESTSARLFRPPFGRLTLRQYYKLKKKFQIVFWDIMPYDFDKSFGSEKSLDILKKYIRPGSVIVLHDSPTSCAELILDEFLSFAVEKGYRFETLLPAP
jgi:peptidoglycan/xylan/chitin deacetylase (PgdA/CDA1 family)